MRAQSLLTVSALFALLLSLPLVSAPAAAEPAATAGAHAVNTSGGFTLAGAPLALRGFDPVAYFTQEKPVAGDPALQAVHDGAAYQFATEANKKTFEADPARYAPQFGGFCAFGVALGKKFDGDPQAWKIVDGKLYLNLNQDIQQKWQEDEAGNLKKAHAAWNGIAAQAPAVINR